MKKLITIIFIVLFFNSMSLKAYSNSRLYLEHVYQNAWCSRERGAQEVVLNDKARVDCVTNSHAIEFDFADKWGESIGQALYYGAALNKKPGIVLIMENGNKDKKYLDRVNVVAKQHNITVWTMKSINQF